MNKVFCDLVNSKIEKFVFDYIKLSRDVFVDSNGALIHAGEFGTYREKIIKELLEPFLPSRLSVGSGFIITCKGNISTQCDLIIYDKFTTPIIENSEQRFFPVECVVGVIEAKSVLTKYQLKQALIKLSKIKCLRNDVPSSIYEFKQFNQELEFNPKLYNYDQIATFIICEQISDFNFDKDINCFFKQTYKDIDKSLFHNMVLSINDGCFMYGNEKNLMYYPYVVYDRDNFKNCVVKPDAAGYDKEQILAFVNYFHMVISHVSIMKFDITRYLGENRKHLEIIEK